MSDRNLGVGGFATVESIGTKGFLECQQQMFDTVPMGANEPLDVQVAVRLPQWVVDELQRMAPAPRLKNAYLVREALIEWIEMKKAAAKLEEQGPKGRETITPEASALLGVIRREATRPAEPQPAQSPRQASREQRDKGR